MSILVFFSKYSASGNDFIITHLFRHNMISYSKLAQKVCNRHEGIGADGLIILKPNDNYDYEWEFYNQDGSAASMCGNGSRVAGAYAVSMNLANKQHRFLSGAGVINISVDNNMVESELGIANILNKNIFEANISWWLIDTGVPHLVAFGDNIFNLDETMMSELRHKYNANVNVARIDCKYVSIRTFERGVEGETLACGTGMAAMFYRLLLERCVTNIQVFKPMSKELVYLREDNQSLFLKGEVRKICDFSYGI